MCTLNSVLPQLTFTFTHLPFAARFAFIKERKRDISNSRYTAILLYSVAVSTLIAASASASASGAKAGARAEDEAEAELFR